MSWYWKVKQTKDYRKLFEILADEMEGLSFRMTAVQTQLLKVQKVIALLSEEYCGEENKGMTELEQQCWSVYEKGPPQKFYLTIPVAPPRLEIHWQNWPRAANRSEVRETWYNFVRAAWDKAAWGDWKNNLPQKPIERFIAVFRFNYGDRIDRDVDNYAIKFIVDALDRCSIIAGDDSRRMSLFVTSNYCDNWGTEVLIYETSEINEVPPGIITEVDKIKKLVENNKTNPIFCYPDKTKNG